MIEGPAIVLAFLRKSASLSPPGAFQVEKLEEEAVVMNRNAPFPVVIFHEGFMGVGPSGIGSSYSWNS